MRRPEEPRAAGAGGHPKEEQLIRTSDHSLDSELTHPTNPNNIFPIPTHTAEIGTTKSASNEIAKAFNSLYARNGYAATHHRNERRRQAATRLRDRLHKQEHWDSSASVALKSLTEDPAEECRAEIAKALHTRPDLLFARGEYIPAFDPERLALPPPAPPPTPADHIKWTSTLPATLRRAITKGFSSSFAQPIMAAIQSGDHHPVPARTHVETGAYGKLLHKMHSAGLLAWRPECVRATQLSEHADVLCMTIFAISKDPQHERLISWPRHANELVPAPPKPDFPKPRHFGYIQTTPETWSGFWLDAANMFHNLAVPEEMRDLFPLQPIAYDDCAVEI